jgi:hypothetical protein
MSVNFLVFLFIYSLTTLLVAETISVGCRIINELEGIYKEAVVAYFKTISRRLSEGLRDTNKIESG